MLKMLKLPGNILCLASWYREVPSGAGCRGFETLNHVVVQIWICTNERPGGQTNFIDEETWGRISYDANF